MYISQPRDIISRNNQTQFIPGWDKVKYNENLDDPGQSQNSWDKNCTKTHFLLFHEETVVFA